MKKRLWTNIFISAVFLGLAANSPAASIPNDPAYETGFRQSLAPRIAGGQFSIEITDDMSRGGADSHWRQTLTAIGGTPILFENSGYADMNPYEIYDQAGPESGIQFFPRRNNALDRQTIYFDGMTQGDYLFSAGFEQSVFVSPFFGFYLGVPDENPGWYSETLLNDDLVDHMRAYQGSGEYFTISNDGYDHPWQSSEYILAWEDLAEQSPRQDYSFNDFVVMVNSVIPKPVPEPATMFLFGVGLAGLASIGIHRRARKA